MKHKTQVTIAVVPLWGSFLAVTLMGWMGGGARADTPEKRPNILFILTDDQAPFSIGAYGNEVCQTPNLDALAKRGMRLDQAYHMGAFQGAVCTASRHMIMSGRTVWHIPGSTSREKILTTLGKTFGLNDDVVHIPERLEKNTIGAVFNRAGYDTMRTCKRGNSYAAANSQFTVIKEASKRGASVEEGSAWHTDQVLEFLSQRQSQGTEAPFMIYFGFSHPHDTRDANDQLLAKYGATNDWKPGALANPMAPSIPVNYLPSHPFNHGHMILRDEISVQGVHSYRDEATIRNEKGREYACIENIDNQIGRVVDQLKASGELENTYVLFTADHGIAIGRHGLMGKQNLYEHCWRVPYIVAGPGIEAGSSATGNVYLLDTLATLCDLAGINPPQTNEGRSFKPVLEGTKESVREVLYGVYCGGEKPGIRSVRKGDWKLIKYENSDGAVKETQLFNLSENPNELTAQHHDAEVIRLTGNTPEPHQRDLAEDPAYAQKLQEMESLLLSEMERLHDPYRFDEGFVNPKVKKKVRKRKSVSAK